MFYLLIVCMIGCWTGAPVYALGIGFSDIVWEKSVRTLAGKFTSDPKIAPMNVGGVNYVYMAYREGDTPFTVPHTVLRMAVTRADEFSSRGVEGLENWTTVVNGEIDEGGPKDGLEVVDPTLVGIDVKYSLYTNHQRMEDTSSNFACITL